jgi:hypothetical protein
MNEGYVYVVETKDGVKIGSTKKPKARIASVEDWDKTSVAQAHSRYRIEKELSKALQRGLVRDWDHLKELIGKL